MRSKSRHPAAPSRRSGLAPLELVLVLPMFMMILAMMIIVGTAGAWKVRTLTNSRQAIARAVWPRNGSGDPNPVGWRDPSARMQFREASPSPFANDPFRDYYVVRGPRVAAPGGMYALEVQQDTLDITQGLHEGFASIDRPLPLWRQLPYRNSYQRDTQMFSGDQWQHGTMGMSTNQWRRIYLTYRYDLADPPEAAAAASRMRTALNAILTNPGRSTLNILDRDDELRTWYGDPYDNAQDRYDWPSEPASVYPPTNMTCSLDLRPEVDSQVRRIQRVPRRLAQKFLQMYQEQLGALPPNSPAAGAIQQKIDQLNAFLQTLPP